MSSQDVFVNINEYQETVTLSLPRLQLCDEVYNKEARWRVREACVSNIVQLLLEYSGWTSWLVLSDVIRGDQPELVCRIGKE